MLTNSSSAIDGEILNKHLTRLKEKSYKFQSKQQLDSVVMETFNFTADQFNRKIVDNSRLPIRHKFLSFLEYSFISNQRKLKFKRSGLMGKELSMYDVSKTSEIFDKNFMVFIDGKLIDCINIIPREGGIDLVLNIVNGTDPIGVSEDVFKEWVSSKSKGCVVFFTNSDFNPLITNREILRSRKQFLSLSESGILDELETDETYISFITSNQHGYRSDLVDVTNKKSMVSFFKELDKGTGNERSFLNIFGFRNLSRVIEVPGDTTVFQIPGYVMPVPVENILIFKQNPHGKEYADDITLTRNYPNFYQVKGNVNGDNLYLLVFFSPQNGLVEGYTNELASYYEIMGEGVTTFEQSPDIVKNYVPTDLEYSIRDFLSSVYDDHYDYKLSKLSELADANPMLLRDFLKDQFETTNGLYINLANVNLTDRIKYNNHQEIDNVFDQVEFPEGRYMITLKDITEGGKYKVNYFIDGLYYDPDAAIQRGKYNYLYIPTSIIKENSYIEVERFQIFDNSRNVTFTPSNKLHSIDIAEDDFTRENIYLVDSNDNVFVPDDAYRVYTVNPDNSIKVYDVGDYSFINKGRVYIESVNSYLENRDITIHVDAYSLTEEHTTVEDSDYHVFHTTLVTKPKLSHLRVFNGEGRLIQYPHVSLESSDVYLDSTEITTMIRAKSGSKYTIDYTPNSYTAVLELDVMPESNILYLKDIIDRPFDLQWYDVYVNGRRLNKSNIKVLSPYLIQIINVASSKNIVIYTREKYKDVILPAPTSKSIIDELWETDPAFRGKALLLDSGSEDTEPDIISEILYFYYKELERMMMDQLEIHGLYHINPDLPQITDEMIDNYPRAFMKQSTIVHLSGDLGLAQDPNSDAIHINPDIIHP